MRNVLIVIFVFCLNSVSSQNLALNKPTEQSSTYGSETAGQSSNAVDGNTDGVRSNNSTTHTLSDDQMWWKVDLGAEYTINEIKVYNRTDGSTWRLNGAEVYIGNIDSNNPSNYVKVGSSLNSDAEQIISNVSGSGRYVMVYLLKLGNSNKFLSLAEVEVYGSSVSNPNPTTSLWSQNGANINYIDGNVGINTTEIPSGYKLAVDGKIITEEVKVQLQSDWPDYVFNKNHNLPTLEEIQKHIAEKGHLINIPSAKEVKVNGIELGEMNKLLLEKIEELTLYILEQEKYNKEQDKRILELEKN